jgi:hypothetical protein
VQQAEIYNYLERFFTSNDCEICERNDGYLTIQLTEDMDKRLMNRPFYWHYLEKTGGTPNPMKLSLITNKEVAPTDAQGEFIHFGSPRLHQIFSTAKELAGHIRLYENMNVGNNIPLHPWLGVNIKISYICDRRKDTLVHFGLNLINGMMMKGFHEKLKQLSLTPKIPDFCFTLAPFIKPKSGLERIRTQITEMINNDDLSWINDAQNRWKEDDVLLDHFYSDVEEKPECYEKKP